jgi:hypothetical protein
MPYMLPVGPGSSAQRVCTSYDVELEAQVCVVQSEKERNLFVVYDATSPVDAALSFSMKHNRHRADFHWPTSS